MKGLTTRSAMRCASRAVRGIAAAAMLVALSACADLGTTFDVARAPDASGRVPLTTAYSQSYATGHLGAEPVPLLPSVEMPPLAEDDVIRGSVSWYGKRFAGRRTANGETFDPAQLTMAHRALPFGTRVRVTNPANGQSVVVRVNDRGPYVGDRVADLSHAAAKKLGMVKSGVIAAELEVLEEDGEGVGSDEAGSGVDAARSGADDERAGAANVPPPGAGASAPLAAIDASRAIRAP